MDQCVAPKMSIIEFGIVEIVVQAATFFAKGGAPNHELGDGREVSKLDQFGRHAEVPIIFVDLVAQHLDSVARA